MLLKRATATIIPIVFYVVFRHIRAILLPFLSVSSTCNWYQEIVICIPLFYIKCNDFRIKVIITVVIFIVLCRFYHFYSKNLPENVLKKKKPIEFDNELRNYLK